MQTLITPNLNQYDHTCTKMNSCKLFILAAAALFLFSCKTNKTHVEHAERAFYYWKSNEYSLSDSEQTRITALGIKKLYTKFFEVAPDEIFGAKPIAKTGLHIWTGYDIIDKDSIKEKAMSDLEIIPTIFIQNKILYSIIRNSLDTLADNIVFLIDKYYKSNIRNGEKPYREIQLDCDWTKKTRDNYFYLVKAIKKISGKTISCTLSLYPYKYREIMGVPPVDKATLMCYNLLNPLEHDDKNSILDDKELEDYLRNGKKYPLHLDIALPVFSWMQIYQNNEFNGIITPGKYDLSKVIKPIKPLWYEVQEDFDAGDIYLKEGDKLKMEEVSEKDITQAIALLKKNIDFDPTTTITLFHLDENNLKKYSNEILGKFYTEFSNQPK